MMIRGELPLAAADGAGNAKTKELATTMSARSGPMAKPAPRVDLGRSASDKGAPSDAQSSGRSFVRDSSIWQWMWVDRWIHP